MYLTCNIAATEMLTSCQPWLVKYSGWEKKKKKPVIQNALEDVQMIRIENTWRPQKVALLAAVQLREELPSSWISFLLAKTRH